MRVRLWTDANAIMDRVDLGAKYNFINLWGLNVIVLNILGQNVILEM